MDEYNGTIVVKTALIISVYVFVRLSELTNSKWSYIDFDKSEWLIPAELMKMNQEHLIPFPKQVKKLLELLLPITEQSEYIFSNSIHQEKPMSSASVNVALK